MTPNYQQLRRDLGRTAAIILNQAERGTLADYIERAKVPTYDKQTRWNWQVLRGVTIGHATEAELEDNEPLVRMYEIYVNGEFYGVTKVLELDYITRIYPRFKDVLKHEKVDIFDQWTEMLVSSNHIKFENNEIKV